MYCVDAERDRLIRYGRHAWTRNKQNGDCKFYIGHWQAIKSRYLPDVLRDGQCCKLLRNFRFVPTVRLANTVMWSSP